MNAIKSIELIGKYAACEDCGNETVSNGEGTLVITDDTFTRTCKCGWKVEIKVN